ncbi:MAG: heme ABC exporter ATP-binding protein CcmA [Rhodobacteraceae bacterium]|nr:MAG: heme ABC exporter ATP-binding protein CcmA [Paracoccaceae bacterium]
MTVKATNLACARGDRMILQDVSFTLDAGDCLILRGANGAGKSTLLRVLAGLAPLAAGELILDADQMAYSGHQDALKLQLTARENLAFWAGVYDTHCVDQVIADYDLGSFADRPVATLSAGQKRRVGLARLSISERKIWIMDEPTTSLDAENRDRITAKIRDHIAAGGIVILSTHLDLDIPHATALDIAQFGATVQDTSPFLEGDY